MPDPGLGRPGWRRSELPLTQIIAGFFVCLAAVPALTASTTGQLGLGQAQFAVVFMAELTLVLFLVPLLAANMMASEKRGRQAVRFLLPQPEPARRIWAAFSFPLLTTVGLCLAPALAALLLKAFFGGMPAPTIVAASLALTPPAVCALALGSYLSLVCRDLVSALALALLITVLVCAGPVWLGPVIDATPDAALVIQPALAVNPFVGLASAIEFDLFRAEPFYQICPIGQRKFDYPSCWTVASVQMLASLPLFWRSVVRIRRMAEPSA
jgi:hypothetical protein